jgi:hypothetical protein
LIIAFDGFLLLHKSSRNLEALIVAKRWQNDKTSWRKAPTGTSDA